jgi:superfamily II DNA or RNA helicase
MSVNRFSSRRKRLDHAFLADRLRAAKSYKRIAGYFRSSIFELIGEEIANIPDVRIVCNSELDAADITISRHVREATLKQRWNETPAEVEALLHRDRYRKLHQLLTSGRVNIRVVPKDHVFVHGKAGVLEASDGSKTCFLGSINETKSAFAQNYEILWEDTSAKGVKWVEEEFDALWKESFPLPDAIVEEVKRVADRIEVHFQDVGPEEVAAAALVESPIYRGGEQLEPWQRAFVTMFSKHRETYGRARMLLADEVGLGKTLSLAASAMVSALLDDGPVLILCPSTLMLQWQVELKDKLGIPSAVWLSSKKVWLDHNGHTIKTRGPEDITHCPFCIAIVSTGLIFHESSDERRLLLGRRFGTVVLDEAHKARRRGGLGERKDEPNNLLDFMFRIGPRTKNLLLGTATPIQTEVSELWDLMRILNGGADFVLGRELFSNWADFRKALPVVKGDLIPQDEREAWEWLRNPLAPGDEEGTFAALRMQLGIPDNVFFADKGFGALGFLEKATVLQTLRSGFYKDNNPIVRHTVLRRRQTLEEAGLLDKVGVNVHPDPGSTVNYYGIGFEGLGLLTNHPFDLAYKAAEDLTAAMKQRTRAAGFMKTLLLQRICSSFASGKATAEKLLAGLTLEEEEIPLVDEAIASLTSTEKLHLRTIIEELSRTEARDPKLKAVTYFLREHRTEGKTWLEHGCIIFSQYYDTVFWVGSELAKTLKTEPVAVYAGAGKSGIFRGSEFAAVEREEIKKAVRQRNIRLVVATDAACEGLNLQTLGCLINVDLPWNPSRLEQRLGRIRRIGQARRNVDMLNLVYHDTQDEEIYRVLSRRLKDKFDIFGGLPDTIEDDWIENIERLDAMMDEYIHLRQQARKTFEFRYKETIDPDKNRWELCSRVLARTDVVEKLSESW